MNREALFCDGTGDYVIPAEPEINERWFCVFVQPTMMWMR